jgi:hypothetical protein
MPNSTKAIIAIVSIIILISGVFVLTKSRPTEVNLNSNLTSSLVSNSVTSSVLSIRSSTSSQIISSSSQSEAAKVVETTPVVEKPIVEVPKQNNFQLPSSNFKLLYKFSDERKNGGELIADSDVNFLNENIQDIANYYHTNFKNLFPTGDHVIDVNKFKKNSNLEYLVQLSTRINPANGEGAVLYKNATTYKLFKLNQNDGEFEQLYNYTWSEDPAIQAVSNSGATIALPGHIYSGGND